MLAIMTTFASAKDYSILRRLGEDCRKAGVRLTARGEVIVGGDVVGTYELSAGVLVMHGVPIDARWLAAPGLRQVDWDESLAKGSGAAFHTRCSARATSVLRLPRARRSISAAPRSGRNGPLAKVWKPAT
jgi:hypothetical protein